MRARAMNPQYLQVTREDGVLRVLINRPEKRNALSQTVLNEIREVFTAHASDQTLIAATITGAGERCFAAGGDLKEFDGLRERAAVLGPADRAEPLRDLRGRPAARLALGQRGSAGRDHEREEGAFAS